MAYTTVKIIALGGVEFGVSLIDGDENDYPEQFLGSVSYGDIDDEGQWVGDDDDVVAHIVDTFPEARGLQVKGPF